MPARLMLGYALIALIILILAVGIWLLVTREARRRRREWRVERKWAARDREEAPPARPAA